jgi:hypothetical protein
VESTTIAWATFSSKGVSNFSITSNALFDEYSVGALPHAGILICTIPAEILT